MQHSCDEMLRWIGGKQRRTKMRKSISELVKVDPITFVINFTILGKMHF